MLKTEWFISKLQLHRRRIGLPPLCLFVAIFALPSASAQADFTLSLNPATLSPDAIAPGGVSSITIQVVANSGFSGTITLGCTVTPSISGTVSNPVCTVSPPTLNGSGGATATISTQADTTAVSYGIAITATDATGTQTSPTLNLTVLAVVPQFTITILSPVAPSSVPAGSGAQGTVSINSINGYSSPPTSDQATAGVYLSCASITPLVTIAPVCSFNPPNPQVTSSGSATSTLTISTFGPIATGFVARPRSFYALWFPLPLVILAGFGAAASGKRSRKAWGLLALFIMSGSLLLLPACGTNTSTSTSTPNGITPANTYTFTIIGVDTNGVASSNTGSTTTSAGPTVTLSVTAPSK